MADPGSAETTRGGDRGGERGGDRRGFGRGGGGRPGRKPRGEKEGKDKDEWIPTTKLGRLVKANKIKKMETIYHFSLPIKEYQIIDYFLKDLKDEVLKIMPVQKQTPSGQRTRFKAFVVVGDKHGHVGLGVKCSKEVATAIRGGIIAAKLSIIPVRLGYWGNKIGAPHTVPTKVTGKCGSVRVRLVPAPRGTGIVAAGTPHKLLEFAGVDDVYTKTCGHTKTMGNFAMATFHAIQKTFEYITPDLWKADRYTLDPYAEFSRELEDLASEGKKEEKKTARLAEGEGDERRGGRRPFGGERRGFGDRRGFGGGDRGDREGGDDRRGGGDREGGDDRRGGGGDDRRGGFGDRRGGYGRREGGYGDRRGGGFGGRREGGDDRRAGGDERRAGGDEVKGDARGAD